MNKTAAVVFALGFIGAVLLWWNDFGNIRKPPFMSPDILGRTEDPEGYQQYIKYTFFDPLRYIICLEFGILMVSGCMTWFYWKVSGNLQDTRTLIIAAFICSLMPIFELLALVPWWWICMVLVPTVVLGGIWLKLAET